MNRLRAIPLQPQGWICPRCQQVNSPLVTRCDCFGLTPFQPQQPPFTRPPFQPTVDPSRCSICGNAMTICGGVHTIC